MIRRLARWLAGWWRLRRRKRTLDELRGEYREMLRKWEDKP